MKHLLNSPRCKGGLLGLGILMGGVLLALPLTSTAQTCLQDEFGKNTQCTANDVRIASASNVRDPLTGAPITSCIANGTFSFVADFRVVTTATARENIGLYFATGGQGQAKTGSCSDNIISPQHKNPNVDYTANPNAPLLGTTQYEEKDASPDTCGDISTSDNNQIVTVYVQNALCKAAAGTNQVALPNCTSWQQPGGTILCVSPAPSYPWEPAAIPGSPSKCNCDDTFTIPVTVQSPSISVAKACNTANTNSPNPPDFSNPSAPNPSSCTLTEGGQVTYTVDFINDKSNFGSVVIDQVCDTAYGTVFQAVGFSGPACAKGTVNDGAVGNNTTCTGVTVAFSQSATCTFTVNQPEASTVTDNVFVSGHGTSAGNFGPTETNSVTVTSSEGNSIAAITKGFAGNTSACATVRYNVQVTNNSTGGSDETITLSGFNDTAFGDITKLSTSVLGTTCGVAAGSPGLGTLSGVTASASNGGALSTTIAIGSSYNCQFDGTFCGVPDSSTGCFTHSNTVSATLAGDEGEAVTTSGGGLNVKECLQGSTF